MTRLPSLSPERVADAVAALAEAQDDADLRTQLHALAGIVRNLMVPPDPPGLDEAYEQLAAGDVSVPAGLAQLAELELRRVAPVDWTAASHG